MEPHWHILSDLGTILKPSWGHLGPSWRHLGPSWGHLGPSWSLPGSSWSHLGPSWRRLGAILAHLGPILAHLGGLLAHLGAVLEPSWAILAPSWRHLGDILGPTYFDPRNVQKTLQLRTCAQISGTPRRSEYQGGGICVRLGSPGREYKGGEHSLQAKKGRRKQGNRGKKLKIYLSQPGGPQGVRRIYIYIYIYIYICLCIPYSALRGGRSHG